MRLGTLSPARITLYLPARSGAVSVALGRLAPTAIAPNDWSI